MIELRLGLVNNVVKKFIPTKKEFLEKYLNSLRKIEEYKIIQTYNGKTKYCCYMGNGKCKYTRNIKKGEATDIEKVSQEDFDKILKENHNGCIQKIRKYYLDGNFEMGVDYFLKPINMIMVEVESKTDSLDNYKPPIGFIDITKEPIYEDRAILNGSVISNNTILEGTDGVGKTTTIIELLKEGIICQDRCMDMISKNMLFDIPMDKRANKYQNYLKNSDKNIIILVNTDKKELEKRINQRKVLSEFDLLAYEYNKLYVETYNYMEKRNMLENKMFMVDCTGLTIKEQANAVKKIILNKNGKQEEVMNVKGNLIIFSMDCEERKDVRKLKEKKLQIILDENNKFPTFEIVNDEYIKKTAEKEIEKIFNTERFYIEQLYTWGDPNYYTNSAELLVTYLVVINKKDIKTMPEKLKFYDIRIENEENANLQKVTLSNENKELQYRIETIVKKDRQSIEYINKLVEESLVDELTTIIIHTGIKRLRNRIENTNIAFCFLDKEFAISELQQVYEVILDKKLIPANFRKKVEPIIKRTDKIVKESAFRPSSMYVFNEDSVKNWV